MQYGMHRFFSGGKMMILLTRFVVIASWKMLDSEKVEGK